MINLDNIPTNPGCYIFKNNENIIYIGKAKNLKKRVLNYFLNRELDPKTNALVKNIEKVDFIVTKNEVEALLLENTLVKKYQPKYNVNLKDSKKYSYLEITSEDFPRLVISRQKDSGKKIYGPFINSNSRDEIKKFIIKTLKLRTCTTMPKKACLRYHMALCVAPCINNVTKLEYNKYIFFAKEILSGKNRELIQKLNKEMKIYTEKLNFENAIICRDQIKALSYFEEKQNVDRNKKYDEDVVGYLKRNELIYIIVFNVYKGTLSNKQEFIIDDMEESLDDFIVQYYSKNEIPNEIIIDCKIDSSIKLYLEKVKNSKIKITNPKMGEKKNLLDLAIKNIEINIFGNEKKLEEIKEMLNLENLPKIIECFDVSHLSGESVVGSMVQFFNAKPNKMQYRRYKIKSFIGNDDYRSMSEIIYRRYSKIMIEKLQLPDLIVIDGGKGQLSTGVEVLKKLNLKIPIISIAKKNEEIFVPGGVLPLVISKKNKGLHLIQEIRDEAHRFAIKYNRQLRQKEVFS